ncbi:uncharacterized protein LOC119075173 [Bradysia coprophila]|uniref:uncharacterized protein LOC119075173 n=1 Tax=Bradysia coprophila TaxID=38358 RepID=UPI00187D8193|nr:uncharacterized protein LOC119075173 [Bradysia coprophila]
MKITDLNFDCLESCLQHLNIEELLNVADCNKELRHVAIYLIARTFKGRQVTIEFSRVFGNRSFLLTIDDNLWMGSLSLQFLRCCGDLVSGLKITWSKPNIVNRDLIIKYINEYCPEFLTKMEFSYCKEGSLKGLTKPFKKVEKLKMIDTFPPEKKLSELFPNLREFRYQGWDCNLIPNEIIFTDHFPLLEHLTIFVQDWGKYYENVEILLRSHPQLKSLKGNIRLDVVVGSKNNLYANEHLQNLEKLHLSLKEKHFVQTIEERIQIKNLRELVLHFEGRVFNRPTIIPLTSDKLESLEIKYFSHLKDTSILTNSLIANYPSIKKFTLKSRRIMNDLEISKLLPLLKEIDFLWYNNCFTVDEVVSFVKEFRSLKKFQFKSLPEISLKNLIAHLGSAWSVSFKLYNKSPIREEEFLGITIELATLIRT